MYQFASESEQNQHELESTPAQASPAQHQARKSCGLRLPGKIRSAQLTTLSANVGAAHALQQQVNQSPRAIAQAKLASLARKPAVQRIANGDAMALASSMARFYSSAGQELPEPVLQKMESFFGTSFADVRVHVGPEAQSIGALAFTQGADIHFAPGQYDPHTMRGQQLLGHELTHVVQQRAGRVRNPFGSGFAVVQDQTMEAEADRSGLRAPAHPVPLQSKNVTSFQAIVGKGPALSAPIKIDGTSELEAERTDATSATKNNPDLFSACIQCAVAGGEPGDQVVHMPSGELFTVVKVETNKANKEDLYYLQSDVDKKKIVRVYGDVRTYFFVRRDVPALTKLPEPKVQLADWGSVVEVAPGVGVELVGDDYPNYVKFIRAQLRTIISTPAGAALLGQFDPQQPGGRAAQTTPPYKGLTALVAPPPQIKKSKYYKKNAPGLKTEDVGPRKSPTARRHDQPKLPRIQFHDPAKGLQEIGDNLSNPTGAYFSPEEGGVTKHKDAPTEVLPFDLALYHEFVHAFLSHAGVSGRLRESEIAAKLRDAQNADAAEEELVVGILAGKGLPMSENAYRCQRGMQLRGTYKAVGITGDPELGVDPWKPGTTPAALLDAIRSLGAFTVADASYILTGRR